MYTFEPPILYSEVSPAEDRPRSAPILFAHSVVPESTVPLGLFLVAFPPPPVTFPATRPNVLQRERHSTRLADHFQRALSVFIRTTQVSLAADLSKPFGFGSWRP